MATDVAELAAEANIVLLSLPGPDVVRNVITETAVFSRRRPSRGWSPT